MDKLLVVGIEQVVGANLALALSESFSVLGLSHQESVSVAGCHTVACNLDDHEHLAWQIRQFSPQWTICTGALARSSWDSPDERIATDAALAAATVRAAEEVGSRVSVLSTDGMFSAPAIFHDETARPCSSLLSTAALAMENSLLGTTALIVRTNAYGWSCCDEHVSFAEVLWRRLQSASKRGGGSSGEAIEPSPYVCATPILATDLAPFLQRAYESGLKGVLHISGSERSSQRRFAMELAGALGTSCAALGAPPPNQKPVETSLVSLRAQNALQMALPMLREGLVRFAAQNDDGFRHRLRGEGILASAA